MSSPLDPPIDLPTPDSTPTKSTGATNTPPSETSSGFEMVDSNKDKVVPATPNYVPAPASVSVPLAALPAATSPPAPASAVSIAMPPLIPASPQPETAISRNENSFTENGFVFGYLKGE